MASQISKDKIANCVLKFPGLDENIIPITEIHKLVTFMGYTQNQANTQDMIYYVDPNTNGKIDFNKFIDYISSNPNKFQTIDEEDPMNLNIQWGNPNIYYPPCPSSNFQIYSAPPIQHPKPQQILPCNQIFLNDNEGFQEQPLEIYNINKDTTNLIGIATYNTIDNQPKDLEDAIIEIDNLKVKKKINEHAISDLNKKIKKIDKDIYNSKHAEENELIQSTQANSQLIKKETAIGYEGVAFEDVYHTFKVPGYNLPGGDYCSMPCVSIQEAEMIIKNRFNSKYDTATYDKSQKKLYFKKIPGIGKTKGDANCTSYQVGIALGKLKNPEDKNNVFEMRNIDTLGGDTHHDDCFDIYCGRRKILRNLTKYGDTCCNPWGYQRGIWYKNWCTAQEQQPTKGVHYFVYGTSIGVLKKVNVHWPCSPCNEPVMGPCTRLICNLLFLTCWCVSFPLGHLYCIFEEIYGCFRTD